MVLRVRASRGLLRSIDSVRPRYFREKIAPIHLYCQRRHQHMEPLDTERPHLDEMRKNETEPLDGRDIPIVTGSKEPLGTLEASQVREAWNGAENGATIIKERTAFGSHLIKYHLHAGKNANEWQEGPAKLPILRAASPWAPAVVEDIAGLRQRRAEDTLNGKTVGLVPTMGALHEGHLELVRAAAEKCDQVYVSIYVNPTQFGKNEDLATYPKTFYEDVEKLAHLNKELLRLKSRVSTVFTPTSRQMYPFGVEDTSYVILNPSITQILEGRSRPTFFQGVTTVVTKLLNIVQPDMVFFGQKDLQQYVVMDRMIREFHIPVKLVRCRTSREPGGLARSSRNAYLGERRRKVAHLLFRMLTAVSQAYRAGSSSRTELLNAGIEVARTMQAEQQALPENKRVKFEVDYLSLADPLMLEEVAQVSSRKGAYASVAVVFFPLEKTNDGEQLGINGDSTPVRLIDNMFISNAGKPDWLHYTHWQPQQGKDLHEEQRQYGEPSEQLLDGSEEYLRDFEDQPEFYPAQPPGEPSFSKFERE